MWFAFYTLLLVYGKVEKSETALNDHKISKTYSDIIINDKKIKLEKVIFCNI